MSKHKHTPGPWVAVKGAGWYVMRPDAVVRRDCAIAVGMTPAHTIVDGPSQKWFEDAEAEANARLIAEAPAMLAELEQVSVDLKELLPISILLRAGVSAWAKRRKAEIDKLIAKAKGE